MTPLHALLSFVLAAPAPLVGGSDACLAPDRLIGTGLFAFDNTTATTGVEGQTQGACNFYGSTAVRNDVWFSWTAPGSGLATISTCGSASLDTKLAAYAGPGCPAGAALACNDDACTGFQSTISFPCTIGLEYVIQLGLYPNNPPVSGGAGQLAIHLSSPPANDECASPLAIAGTGTFAFDTGAATTSTQGQTESLCLASGQTAIAADQWFAWTPTVSGTATLSLCAGIASASPDEDTKVAVYVGAACPTAAAIACNDDAGCGINGYVSSASWTTTCGATYVIQLGRFPFSGPVFGTFTITESGGACPAAPVGYCSGDGSATTCPCANAGASGRGCANSIDAGGALLAATGLARLSADTMVLQGSGMPNSTALYFQGTGKVNAGLGALFGDGLRCASGTVIRFGTQVNVAGSSQFPSGPGTTVSGAGAVGAPGHRMYQIWYRNADPTFCTASTFNLSNGLDVTWAP